MGIVFNFSTKKGVSMVGVKVTNKIDVLMDLTQSNHGTSKMYATHEGDVTYMTDSLATCAAVVIFNQGPPCRSAFVHMSSESTSDDDRRKQKILDEMLNYVEEGNGRQINMIVSPPGSQEPYLTQFLKNWPKNQHHVKSQWLKHGDFYAVFDSNQTEQQMLSMTENALVDNLTNSGILLEKDQDIESIAKLISESYENIQDQIKLDSSILKNELKKYSSLNEALLQLIVLRALSTPDSPKKDSPKKVKSETELKNEIKFSQMIKFSDLKKMLEKSKQVPLLQKSYNAYEEDKNQNAYEEDKNYYHTREENKNKGSDTQAGKNKNEEHNSGELIKKKVNLPIRSRPQDRARSSDLLSNKSHNKENFPAQSNASQKIRMFSAEKKFSRHEPKHAPDIKKYPIPPYIKK